jgi:polyvinyl alcohol dehydrogenase (cytochrome)
MKSMQGTLLKRGLPLLLPVLAWLMLWSTGFAAQSTPQMRGAVAPSNWPTYNYNLAASGDNTAETTLTTTTFPRLKVKWTAHGANGLSAQPIVVGNVVYWGSWDGNMHATALSGTNAGKSIWTRNLGVTTGGNGCNPKVVGIASTAAYGLIGSTPVIYVGGGGNDTIGGGHPALYALNATTGAVIWKTAIGTSPGDFAWSSPVVYNGSLYYGIASLADCPLTRGRLIKVDAATGHLQATFYAVPSGCVAGGIWGSPSIDTATGLLYVPTGTPTPDCFGKTGDYSMSLLVLDTTNLSYVASWQVPPNQVISADSDFGSVPTLFTATINGTVRSLVGVANKNGTFYAFDRAHVSSGPIWQKVVALAPGGPQSGGGSIAPAVWDGQTLYVAGGNTKIGGASCKGSVRALNPASGAFKWERCLTGPVLGSLAAVPGVVVVPSGSSIIALNMSTGKTIFTYHDTSNKVYWAPASIANGHLFAANMDSSLVALGL